ncbi:hypothetical protein DFQ26_000981, partial [Actinomortierella ambigua]
NSAGIRYQPMEIVIRSRGSLQLLGNLPIHGFRDLAPRRLQGCLVQSGHDVIWCLKVKDLSPKIRTVCLV